jgi:leucyl aminopeptidase
MKVAFAKAGMPATGTVVVGVGAERPLGTAAQELDRASGGAVTRAIGATRFAGKKDETLTLLAPAGLSLDRILVVGTGDPAKLDAAGAEALGGTVVAALAKTGVTEAAVLFDLPAGLETAPASGALLRSYRFDRYRTTEKPEKKPSLEALTFHVADVEAAAAAFEPARAVAESVAFARDLVSEPANAVYPESLAERCRELSALGLAVEVLDLAKLKELGMGALVGVAQGSAREPRVVVLRWNGAPGAADPRPVAFVGKGVTFDSGGISLKPGAGMEDMKWDMAGSAAVIGAMRALAARKAKANVIGIVGLVENMPSGTAQRPGDVVTSMSGQTIEVINTDAEGRLVLADVVWYANETFKPRAIIDLATLTGAIIIALGTDYAGLFATTDELAEGLTKAGAAVGEPVWRMPLGDAYDKELDSAIADMKNMGNSRNGGSIIGAQFIKRFVKDTPWAHVDIAGVAWSKKDHTVVPKGATAFGVRLLDRYVADTLEK